MLPGKPASMNLTDASVSSIGNACKAKRLVVTSRRFVLSGDGRRRGVPQSKLVPAHELKSQLFEFT